MVITGAGEKAFAAGADIKEMSDKSPAVKLAKEVTARGPIAVRLAKQAVLASFEITLEEGLEMERKNFYLSKAM
jgi:enoyl-CoA hydratase/carnithine racemase